MQQRKNCQPGSKMHSALNNRSRRLQKCTHCSAFVASTASAPNPRRCSNQRFSNLLRHSRIEKHDGHMSTISFFFTQQHTKTVTKKNLPLLPFCCFLFFLLPAAASSAFFFFLCKRGADTLCWCYNRHHDEVCAAAAACALLAAAAACSRRHRRRCC